MSYFPFTMAAYVPGSPFPPPDMLNSSASVLFLQTPFNFSYFMHLFSYNFLPDIFLFFETLKRLYEFFYAFRSVSLCMSSPSLLFLFLYSALFNVSIQYYFIKFAILSNTLLCKNSSPLSIPLFLYSVFAYFNILTLLINLNLLEKLKKNLKFGLW